MANNRSKRLSIYQHKINAAIRSYLEQLQRPTEFVDAYIKGHCAGYAIVAAYGCFLEDTESLKPSKPIMASDNWQWFESTVQLLCKWSQQLHDLTDEHTENIERLVSLVTGFHSAKHFFGVRQSEIAHTLRDTHGRQPSLEYQLGGVFLTDDLHRPLDAPRSQHTTSLMEVLCRYPHRIILLSNSTHMISLYTSKHDQCVYLYNSNARYGRVAFQHDEYAALAKAIMKSFRTAESEPVPIAFYVYNMDGKPAPYPNNYELLSSAKPCGDRTHYLTHRLADVGLHMAARTKCIESLRYYLNHGGNPHVETIARKSGKTPYKTIISNNLMPTIKQAAKQYPELNALITKPDAPIAARAPVKPQETLVPLSQSPDLLFFQPNPPPLPEISIPSLLTSKRRHLGKRRHHGRSSCSRRRKLL